MNRPHWPLIALALACNGPADTDDKDVETDGTEDTEVVDTETETDVEAETDAETDTEDTEVVDTDESDVPIDTGDLPVYDPDDHIDDDTGCAAITYDQLSPHTEGIPRAGMALWLRADRGVRYHTLGSMICRWEDQSPNANDLADTRIPDSPPDFIADAVNGQSALDFGTARFMQRSDVLGIAADSARTFIVVSKVGAGYTTQRSTWLSQRSSVNTSIALQMEANTWQSSGTFGGYATNNSFDGTVAVDEAWHTHVLSWDDFTVGLTVIDHMVLRTDGVTSAVSLIGLQAGGDGTAEDFSTADETRLSGYGMIAEVLVYDRVLTADELTAVEGYLGTRYGL